MPNGVVVIYLRLVHLHSRVTTKMPAQLANDFNTNRSWQRCEAFDDELQLPNPDISAAHNAKTTRMPFALRLNCVWYRGALVRLPSPNHWQDRTVLKLKTAATTTYIHSTANMGVCIGLYRNGRAIPCCHLSTTRSDAVDFRNYSLDFG